MKELTSSGRDLGRFDLVYSAGLYDYLPDRTVTSLSASLFDLLHPGGRLIVANFVPGIFEVGYMEVFMAWQLTYRTMTQLRRLVTAPGRVRTFLDPSAHVAYLELTRIS